MPIDDLTTLGKKMRELLTAKANVDRLLKMDEEQKKEQEKDHGQR